MQPIIGITSSAGERDKVFVNKTYVNAVTAAGGIPLVLPIKPGLETRYLTVCDGLLFSGGGDVQGRYFGQENHERISGISEGRDAFEIELARLAFAEKKPLMGICRGEQVINIALGGGLIQHIDGHSQKDAGSCATHRVRITENSMLHNLLGRKEACVNSFHHQVADKLAEGFAVSAVSEDGYTEAYEYTGSGWFCHCFQWHPELMLESPEHGIMLELFKRFIDACSHRLGGSA